MCGTLGFAVVSYDIIRENNSVMFLFSPFAFTTFCEIDNLIYIRASICYLTKPWKPIDNWYPKIYTADWILFNGNFTHIEVLESYLLHIQDNIKLNDALTVL